MFNYGSQVNPALGRSDFSGILQGQMQANQAMMQGAQAQGQAYASIGQSLAKGIEQYSQNQTLINDAIGKFSATSQSAGPEFVAKAPEPVAKAIEKLNGGKSLSLSDAAMLGTYSDTYSKQASQKAIDDLHRFQVKQAQDAAAQDVKDNQALQMALAPYNRSMIAQNALQNGAKFEDLSKLPEPPAPNMGQILQTYFSAGGSPKNLDRVDSALKMMLPPSRSPLADAKTQAEIDKLNAETAKMKTPPGRVMSQQEFVDHAAGLRALGLTPDATPNQNGTWTVTGTRNAPSQMYANPSEQMMAQQQDKILTDDYNAGKLADANLAQLTRLHTMVSTGAIDQGPAADIQNEFRNWGKVLGFSVDEKRLANAQEAKSYMLQTIFDKIQQTKGAITERENQMFLAMGPEIGKSQAANAAITEGLLLKMRHMKELGMLHNQLVIGKIKQQDWLERRAELTNAYEAKLADYATKALGSAGTSTAKSYAERIKNF